MKEKKSNERDSGTADGVCGVRLERGKEKGGTWGKEDRSRGRGGKWGEARVRSKGIGGSEALAGMKIAVGAAATTALRSKINDMEKSNGVAREMAGHADLPDASASGAHPRS